MILKSDDAQRKFDLKSQQRLRPKLHDTKFNYQLYYSHFEIPEFSQYQHEKKGFYISFCIRDKNDAMKGKNGAI